MNASHLNYIHLNGRAALPYLDALGALRIEIFREFPYLYEGDLAYERSYIANYCESPRSLIVLACDGDKIVGATTCIPLVDAESAWQKPFATAAIDLASVFYFGESVLLPQYRGRGVGGAFFDAREAYAASFPEIKQTAFCAVRRAADDMRRPKTYRSLESFWEARGYHKVPGLTATFEWKELGDTDATPKLMEFWLRKLRQ